MGVTEKLKAVQFWNVVSEKLQDIVNKNAADINAVALKMDDSVTNEVRFICYLYTKSVLITVSF